MNKSRSSIISAIFLSAIAPSSIIGCNSTIQDPLEHANFYNSVPGHCDILVSNDYRVEFIDYFTAATESLGTDRFVIAFVSDYYGQLSYRRYDVGDGGFIDTQTVLGYSVRNVHKAGLASATEGGTTQNVAWLVWDYHPSSSFWSISLARIRNDGTRTIAYNIANDAAGASGARGNLSEGLPRPVPRILIAYASGNIRNGEAVGILPCGDRLEALIYDPTGTIVNGPLLIEEAEEDNCLGAPSVAFNSYAGRFEIVYEHRDEYGAVWWHAKYVTPDGTVEISPHDLLPQCGSPMKSEGGILTGPECHRHTLAFDQYSARNTTNRFSIANYGWVYNYRQDWSLATSIHAELHGRASIVDIAIPGSAYSYQTFQHVLNGNFNNPKLFDNGLNLEDADPIGTRPCDNGGPRGDCYYNEAMATGGSYTALLYGDQSYIASTPLLLCITNSI